MREEHSWLARKTTSEGYAKAKTQYYNQKCYSTHNKSQRTWKEEGGLNGFKWEWTVVEKSEISKIASAKSFQFDNAVIPCLLWEDALVISGRIYARKLCIRCVKTCFSQEDTFLHVLNNVLLWAAGGAVEFHWVQLGRFCASKIPNLLSLVNYLKDLISSPPPCLPPTQIIHSRLYIYLSLSQALATATM